ncbi:MAG TPA: response regulator transcription factor [Orrella sp.]
MNNQTNTSLGAFKALVVEDDRFFQEVIREGMTQAVPGSRIDLCRTIQEAHLALQEHGTTFQMAIIDLGLPDGDGLSVIRELAKISPRTPIMVVSVAADERRVIEAVRAGATGYVVKGDTMLSITRAIEQLLNGINPISAKLAGYFLRLAGRESPRDHAETPIKRLTARELDLLREFALGKSYQEAAEAMQISLTTVQTHTRNLYRKLGVKSSLRALSKAKDHGLI